MKKHIGQKTLTTIIHVMVWGFVFALPLFFSRDQEHPFSWEWYLGFCITPLACIFVFYTNLFCLIDHVLFRKRLVRFIAINLLLVILLGVSTYSLRECQRLQKDIPDKEQLEMKRQGPPHPRPPAILFLGQSMLLMGLTVALSVAIKMTENWYKTEREKRELEKARTEAELQNLKNQLNPHFLFNTLNNIYSLIAIDQERAQLAVQDLSRLLRHVLYDNTPDMIPLEREFEFTRSYIKLMSLRLSKNTTLEVHIPETGKGLVVAPLLFIPLVENAFKHGVSTMRDSYIRVSIEVQDDNRLECVVENTNFPKKDNDRSGSGIGLQNLRRRLELLYPDRYSFEAAPRGERFLARLTIHLKHALS